MLGKLIKYDMKAIGKYLIPTWLIAIAITVVTDLLHYFTPTDSSLGVELLRGFSKISYIISIYAVTGVAMVLIVMRFYKNTFGKQGYLTFTLPVTTHQILLSQLLSAFIYLLASTAISWLIIIFHPGFVEASYNFDGQMLVEIVEEIGGVSVFLIGLIILLTTVNSILTFYMAMGFGQLSNKHKVLMSVVSYFVIYIVLQLLIWLVVLLVIKQFSVNESWQMISPENAFSVMRNFLIGTTVILAGIGIGKYSLVHYLCQRKLNLQ